MLTLLDTLPSRRDDGLQAEPASTVLPPKTSPEAPAAAGRAPLWTGPGLSTRPAALDSPALSLLIGSSYSQVCLGEGRRRPGRGGQPPHPPGQKRLPAHLTDVVRGHRHVHLPGALSRGQRFSQCSPACPVRAACPGPWAKEVQTAMRRRMTWASPHLLPDTPEHPPGPFPQLSSLQE